MAENQALVYVLNSKYSAKFAISTILTNPQQDTKSDNFSHYALNLHEGVKRMAVFFFMFTIPWTNEDVKISTIWE